MQDVGVGVGDFGFVVLVFGGFSVEIGDEDVKFFVVVFVVEVGMVGGLYGLIDECVGDEFFGYVGGVFFLSVCFVVVCWNVWDQWVIFVFW